MCTEDFATGSPRPVVVRICLEAGLLVDGGPVLRLAIAAPSRAPWVKGHAQWPCRNLTVHSCGGSRGLDRVPFLASAHAEEPRRRKATQGVGAGQSPERAAVYVQAPSRASSLPHGLLGVHRNHDHHKFPVGASLLAIGRNAVPACPPCQLTPRPRPCSPVRLVTGALHRVKRETGESCALLQGHVSPVLPPQR